MLADSSQILVNHTTEISIVPSGEGRLVTLQGEALFRVRHTGEPFLVRTAVGTVRVLGTEFNVRMREEMLEVAVLSGSVEVSPGPKTNRPSIVLSTGEFTQLRLGQAPSSPEKLLFPDYPGWMHGKLVLQRSTVSSVCAEIESRFDVEVAIEKPGLGRETLTGVVDARNPASAVATLARLTGSRYRYEKNAYSLY
jgi:transmembrane sensor